MVLLELILIAIVIVFLLYLMGQYTFWLPPKSWNLPRILMLHQVNSQQPASGMNMPPTKFENLLQLLQAKQCKTVTMSEWLARVEKGDTYKLVALTFDDGFLDNFTEAFPLLQKYQMKATIFLAPQFAAIDKVTEAHIRQMHKSGLIEFGAHTLTHPNLNNIDDVQAKKEIIQSKQWVEQLLGQCDNFAYPFGRFSEKHMLMVQEAGFKSAVSTKKRIAPFSSNLQYCLPRIGMSGLMNSIQLRIALRVGRYRL